MRKCLAAFVPVLPALSLGHTEAGEAPEAGIAVPTDGASEASARAAPSDYCPDLFNVMHYVPVNCYCDGRWYLSQLQEFYCEPVPNYECEWVGDGQGWVDCGTCGGFYYYPVYRIKPCGVPSGSTDLGQTTDFCKD